VTTIFVIITNIRFDELNKMMLAQNYKVIEQLSA